MKKLNIKVWAGAMLMIFLAASCEDYLDVNENPNAATSASAALVLPQAIVASASIANTYNSYGGHFGGYIANAGGFSGFGLLFSYNLTPSSWGGSNDNLWTITYQDALIDLQYVIDQTEGSDELAYFNAAAKIMSVVNYQRLVDAFGDIPYSQAVQGAAYLTPAYDDAATVYAALIAKLDEAIAIIDNAVVPLRLTKNTDPLFGAAPTSTAERDIDEQMLDWKKYANTLKLRMLIRTGNTAGIAALDYTLGFLTDDAIVDPGYEKNKPNPEWATWGRTTTDALANSSRVPTTFAYTFYTSKINDPGRGETLYVNYPSTPNNQLGNEVGNPTIIANTVTWASNQAGFEGTGVLKGPGMGQPLMLAAEAHFLLAEARLLQNDIPASKASFNRGIKASFAYMFKDENETMKDTTGRVATYFANNNTNDLVIYDLATTTATRLEAIITQKYIAMNMITSDESWNEYRRTGYPVTVPGGAAQFDIASKFSTITSRADRLPTRLMYPSTEQSYNASNYVNIDYTSDLIFWDPN
jgi:hypothetical protein